jgi:hypothetical protein
MRDRCLAAENCICLYKPLNNLTLEHPIQNIVISNSCSGVPEQPVSVSMADNGQYTAVPATTDLRRYHYPTRPVIALVWKKNRQYFRCHVRQVSGSAGDRKYQ